MHYFFFHSLGPSISFASMVCNYLYGLIFLLCVSLLFDVSTFHCERPYLALYSACAIFHMANSDESSEKYF